MSHFHFAKIASAKFPTDGTGRELARGRAGGAQRRPGARKAPAPWLEAPKFCQHFVKILAICSSSSAVSAPNFASKYAFFVVLRQKQD